MIYPNFFFGDHKDLLSTPHLEGSFYYTSDSGRQYWAYSPDGKIIIGENLTNLQIVDDEVSRQNINTNTPNLLIGNGLGTRAARNISVGECTYTIEEALKLYNDNDLEEGENPYLYETLTDAQAEKVFNKYPYSLIKGGNSATFGVDLVSCSSSGHTSGTNNFLSGRYSTALGQGLRSNTYNQTLVGTFNEKNTNALFIVGDGTDHDRRSNALVVLKDGRVQSSTVATSNNDLINKKFADDTYIKKILNNSGSSGVLSSGNNSNSWNTIKNYTSNATPNTLVERNRDGLFNILTPTSSAHPTTKSYVDDNFIAKTYGVASSVLIKDPSNNLSYKKYSSGINSNEDDPSSIGGSIVSRNNAGYFNVPTPTSTLHPVTKAYADSYDFDIVTSDSGYKSVFTFTKPNGSYIRKVIQIIRDEFDIYVNDYNKSLLNGTTDILDNGQVAIKARKNTNTLANIKIEGINGISVTKPSSIDIINIGLDEEILNNKINTTVSSSLSTSLANYIPKVTNSTGGSALLATGNNTNTWQVPKRYTSEVIQNTIVERNSQGYFNVKEPTGSLHPATKKYVDAIGTVNKPITDLHSTSFTNTTSWKEFTKEIYIDEEGKEVTNYLIPQGSLNSAYLVQLQKDDVIRTQLALSNPINDNWFDKISLNQNSETLNYKAYSVITSYMNKTLLPGDKIVTLGDSYFDDSNIAGKLWIDLFANKYQLNVEHHGISGSTVAYDTRSLPDNSPNPAGGGLREYKAMAVRVDDPSVSKGLPQVVDDTVKMVLFDGGRNDLRRGIDIGDVSLSNTDIATFSGAVNHIINKLKYLYPNALIIGITVWNVDETYTFDDIPRTQDSFGEAMKTLCTLNNIVCLDQLNEDFTHVYMNDPEFRATYCKTPTDVSHLNEAGQAYYLPIVEPFIKQAYADCDKINPQVGVKIIGTGDLTELGEPVKYLTLMHW